MWIFVLMGLAIATVGMIAGYLLGYSHGRAEDKAMWKTVFQELRDFDEEEKPSD